jgi:hypothetical protein
MHNESQGDSSNLSISERDSLITVYRSHIWLLILWEVCSFLYSLAIIYLKARSIVLARHTVKLLHDAATHPRKLECATHLRIRTLLFLFGAKIIARFFGSYFSHSSFLFLIYRVRNSVDGIG